MLLSVAAAAWFALAAPVTAGGCASSDGIEIGPRLAQWVEKRRDKIVARYFAGLNPLADFALTTDAIRFANYGEDAGLARVEAYEWFRSTTRRAAPSRWLLERE